MPVYEFECGRCGVVERVLPMSALRTTCACPGCGQAIPRVICSAPRLGGRNSGRLQADGVNERARHDPLRSSSGDAPEALRSRQSTVPQSGQARGHPAGCSCCQTGKTRTAHYADGSRSFPGARPWMISH